MYHLKVPFVGGYGHDVQDRDDVLVTVEMSQQLQFTQNAFRVDVVAERVLDLLDGDVLASDCI